eukprot:TRINITY_DN2442_c0_g2_i2.p1 TRINITY_DN2442_c0_g2~~TRINITY_DN2442_c0_g2_i2.p1  ORF type:complete len:854 (+),score=288.11 TRINITY_DN2442_c0_g2_i2:80-2641(+)
MMDSMDPSFTIFQDLNNYAVDSTETSFGANIPPNSNSRSNSKDSRQNGNSHHVKIQPNHSNHSSPEHDGSSAPEIECILYHKPRGCKGIWKQVEKHNAIRVTKGKGKWLKLDIRSPHPFHSNDVDVFLVDISGVQSQQEIINKRLVHNEEEGITIESTQEGAVTDNSGVNLLEVELKLDRVCKRLQFWAVLKMKDGRVLIGRSAEFAAHNNGKTKLDEVSSPISSDQDSLSSPEAITLTEMPSSIPKNISLATRELHHPESPDRDNNNHPPSNSRPHKTKRNSGDKSSNGHSNGISVSNGNNHHVNHAVNQASNGNRNPNPSNQLSQMLATLAANPNNVTQSSALSSLMATVNGNNAGNSQVLPNSSQTFNNNPQFNFNPTPYPPISNDASHQSMFNSFNNHQNNDMNYDVFNSEFEMEDVKPVQNNKRSRLNQDEPRLSHASNFQFTVINSQTQPPVQQNINNQIQHVPAENNTSNTTTIPSSLTVNGVVKAHAFIQFSDLRLKANLQELTDAVNIISQLEGKSYTWKNDIGIGHETGGRRVIGLIAQQVQKVVPEIVYEDKETGLLSVSYAEIVPILIEAFKQQSTENQARQEGVQKELNDLSARLEEIDRQIYWDSPEPRGVFGKIGRRISRALDPSSQTKKNLFRGCSVLAFLTGLFFLIFGSITLGILLFSADAVLHTEVVSASGLKQMDRVGFCDPYVELDFGSENTVTRTRWNTSDPVWGQIFSIPIDPATTELTYVVYDADENPDYGPRRMGIVVIPLKNLTSGQLTDAIYQLSPSSPGDTTSGTLRLTLLLTYKKSPDYQIVLIVLGIILIVFSLVFGTFIWRRPKSRSYLRRKPLLSGSSSRV